MKPRRTVSEMLDTITSFEELEAFSEMLRKPPVGAVVKPASESDWNRIAQMKIQFQKGRGHA